MDQGVIDRLQARNRDRPELLKQRKTLAEHPFGTIKWGMNQGFFLLKGISNVTTETGLTVLSYNLKRVLNYVLAERDLTDILLNHSVGFDRELDARILDFYERVADQIQRSLDLGIEMNLVRKCDTRAVAYCILGGIKEVVGHVSRHRRRNIGALAEEILDFGLRGVARPELLEAIAFRQNAAAGDESFSRLN